MKSSHSSRQGARGFTLIEVLIAFLLLAIGVLGLAGTQLSSLKFNQTASARTQASFLAYSIADAMRANKSNAAGYDITINADPPTGTSIADKDVSNWRASLKSQLPDGTGSISRSGGLVTITVRWDERRVKDGLQQQTFSMVTQL